MKVQASGKSNFPSANDLKKAVRLHRDGDLEQARGIYLELLKSSPQNPDALHLLGVVAYQNERFAEACDLICRAIRLAPDQAPYYLNLGNAYREGHLFEQAAACFKRAIELDPEYSVAYYNLANTLYFQGKHKPAVQYYQDAVRLNPNLVDAYLNLGQIFEHQAKTGRAIACYQRVLQLKPDSTNAFIRLGSLYQHQNNHPQAINCLKKAIALNPTECYRVFNNLGASQRALGKTDDAIACFNHALKLKPDYVTAYYNLGVEYHLLGELDRSIRILERAVALVPDHCDALNLLVHLLQRTCDWEKLPIYAERLDRGTQCALKNQERTAEAVYTNVLRHPDPSLNYALSHSRSRDIEQKIADDHTKLQYKRSTDKLDKIIVGYLSADFRNHPIAHLIQGLFRLHNRSQFKICCYSYGPDDGSRYRHQIMQDCDHFVDARKMSSRQIANRIVEDGVCILIDLMGHTAGNRLDVCAWKPAPIQVTYLGFPGTTGADFIDYIITDPIVSPPAHAPFYSEKFVYMPHCYQVNNNRQKIAIRNWQRKDFGLPDDGFVFSSFNQSVKIEPVMFDCWMNILNRVPESVLWLLWDNQTAAENLRRAAQTRDVRPDRLIFSTKLPKAEHLARIRLADLALDTRIYNGHTTTSDSLWSGIPVITVQGPHFASRVSASILTAVQSQELITQDLCDYENLAVDLASNLNKLRLLQRKLSGSLNSGPLFDTAGFTQNMEIALREMWQIFQNGSLPRQIDVRELICSATS